MIRYNLLFRILIKKKLLMQNFYHCRKKRKSIMRLSETNFLKGLILIRKINIILSGICFSYYDFLSRCRSFEHCRKIRKHRNGVRKPIFLRFNIEMSLIDCVVRKVKVRHITGVFHFSVFGRFISMRALKNRGEKHDFKVSKIIF